MAQGTKLTVSPTNVEALLDELTDQQRVYTEARMHGLAPLEACKAAGYKHASIQWHSLEKHPKIAPLIKLAVDAPIEKFRISREDVIQGFMDSINAASTSTELTAAWREIAKMQGYYAPDQIEIKHSVENMTLNKLEAMPESELAKLAEMEAFTLPREHDLVAQYEVLVDDKTSESEED
jgi:hypothetical protein